MSKRALTLILLGAVPAFAAAQTPRALAYRLDVGDRLVFERHSVTTSPDGAQTLTRTDEAVQLWALARDGDDLLVLLQLDRKTNGRAEPARAALFSVDPGGRRRLPPETLTHLDGLDAALDCLPVLPLGAQSDAAWTTAPDPYERVWRCVNRGSDSARAGHLRVDFVVEDRTGAAAAAGHTQTGTFWFDPAAGVLSRFEQKETSPADASSTESVGAFRERLNHSAEWCARRAEEGTRWLRALGHEDRLLQELLTPGAEPPKIFAQLERVWSGFKSDCDARAVSPFLALADARRQELKARQPALEARATLARRWLNQAAVTWTLQDATGATVICEQARQGVAIECFWSGASPLSNHALEQLRVLAPRLPSARVRIIAYNVDRHLEQALAIIRACGGGLTQILGGPLLEADPLPELPVVRVLDRRGLVRGLWIGYLPDYSAVQDLAIQLADLGQLAP
jgi:hypothetical protein